ncbi:hypothetical protein M4D51_08060 [Microbacterium sp. p3-SID338]|uniref:hypothetical protein n=1 Tax=Microbacterium sp. p3-SID338 TaxID=2916214 RepID=UPI0021A37583|nr:hypothetical protein [Microbacterium sp. p3-SID338]MCT1395679.1 hypothetical protein [Microbacterium sp. p3-SID338]
MPTKNARKHDIPAAGDQSATRATIFETFGNSIRDIVPVANVNERAQLVADLTAKGQGPAADRPLFVYRADAPGIHRLEFTVNGTVWLPASGTLFFATKAAADSFGTSNPGLLSVNDECRVGTAKYLWSGTEWISNEGLILPTSVVGGTIDATGAIIPNTGVNLVRLNGIFSAKYRAYEVQWAFNFSASAATTLYLTQNGTAHTAPNYNSQRLSAADTGVSANRSQSQSSWPGAGMTGVFLQGSWKFTNPYHLGPKYLNIDAQPAVGIGLAIDRGWLGAADSTLFDGIEFRVTGQTINGGGTSFLKVRGVA